MADEKRETTEQEHARKESELEEARQEHLRRTNLHEGTPERISSAEDTQRQLDEIPNKSPQD